MCENHCSRADAPDVASREVVDDWMFKWLYWGPTGELEKIE